MLGNFNDIDLRMLRIFCTIVEAGGFTAAQVRLNTSLPRLSVLIRDLEIRLGYSLCKRGKGGFQLTEDGEQTYAAAQELFANVSHFRQRTEAIGEHGREVLPIGMVDSLITHEQMLIPRTLAQYRKGTPHTRIDLHVMRPDELEQAVLEERLLLAVGAFHHQLSGLRYEYLFDEDQHLYCSSEHPFFSRSGVEPSLKEIGQADYVERGYMAESRRPCEVKFSHAISAWSMEAIATLIFSGTYIGYLPTHYAQPWVAKGRLRSILPARLGYQSAFHCITRQGVEPTSGAARFLEVLYDIKDLAGARE
jgi:DNA-binding transcriptional LysR family regulator